MAYSIRYHKHGTSVSRMSNSFALELSDSIANTKHTAGKTIVAHLPIHPELCTYLDHEIVQYEL